MFAGNTNDAVVFPGIMETMESRFGKARRVWVLDRGIASQKNLDVLRERNQSFLVGTPRSRLGDILLETVAGRTLRLRRLAQPNPEQAKIVAALGLCLPERICADCDVTPREFTSESASSAAGANE